MFDPRVLHSLVLVWFFGWGILLLRFPAQCYRMLSLGKTPNSSQIKRAVYFGYGALFFGCVFVFELAFGFVPWAR